MLKNFISRRFMPYRVVVLLLVGCFILLGARSRHAEALHPTVKASPAPELVGTAWLTCCAFNGGEAKGSDFPFGSSPCTTRKPMRGLAEFVTHEPRFAERRKRIIDE